MTDLTLILFQKVFFIISESGIVKICAVEKSPKYDKH